LGGGGATHELMRTVIKVYTVKSEHEHRHKTLQQHVKANTHRQTMASFHDFMD
jgi:hypothetical protein